MTTRGEIMATPLIKDSRRFVDVREAICPHPVSLIRDALDELEDGGILEALTDHRAAAQRTIPQYCREKGFPIEVAEDGSNWRIVIIKRAGEPHKVKLEVKGVCKTFRGKDGAVAALDDVSLEIREGEFVCFVGPSGCGKSTLLNIIAGLDQAEAGTVLVNGQAVTRPGPDRVVVFQEPSLFPWLSVKGNVAFGLQQIQVQPRVRDELVADYLKLVHLTKFANALPHQLSGGMKQRAALARGLVMNPDVLLMDEPFAALDAQTKGLLQRELLEISAKTKKTIIFVTHDVREAVLLADRVLVFSYRPGRIKREFRIDRRAARGAGDSALGQTASAILEELRFEVERAVKEEFGE